jgi:flagellar hook-basal body complex protein FliE
MAVKALEIGVLNNRKGFNNMDIAGIGNLAGLSNLSGISNLLEKEALSSFDTESSFADVLTDTLAQYQQSEAGNTIDTVTLLSGNTNDLSTTMISSEKAEIALNLTIAIRNKAITAYNEIMNMQI